MNNGADKQTSQSPSDREFLETTSTAQTQATPIVASIDSVFRELTDLSTLLVTTIFHPVDAFRAHAPYLNPYNMFGGVSFTPEKDIHDLSGKVVLVTGANTGLGKEMVLQLAKHNPAQIFLAARTESKANDAIASIKSVVPDAKISHLPLDLTSFDSVKESAKIFKSNASRLDLLVLNAGIMAVPEGKTESGHEIQLGTNHIGHFLLVKQLLPTLLSTAAEPNADVRVISLSSEAWNMGPKLDTIMSTEKLSACGTWTRYGASKVANILFAAELARRHPQLTSVSVHPGLITTDLYASNKNSNPILRYGMALVGPLVMQNVQKGAYNQLWATAGAKKEDLKNGAYYTPVGREGRGNSHAKNEDEGKRLWEWTEEELAKSGF